MEENEKFERARKRAEMKLGFYIHAGVYAAVNLLLVAINLTSSPETLWFIWPLTGWGVGLLFHGMLAFSGNGSNGLRDRLIQKELKKLD